MRQLITRLDDELHTRIKDKARAEGRSVNDLVRGLLEAAVADTDPRRDWKRRMITAGRVVVPDRSASAEAAPGRDRVAELLREVGPELLNHLDESRGDR